MDGSKLDILTCLPTVLACETLTRWLFSDQIARLDSAYCVRTIRPKLLELFRSDEFSLSQIYPTEIDWFNRREIKISHFNATSGMKIDLTKHGSLVKSATLMDGAESGIIQAIAANCQNLQALSICMDHPDQGVFTLLRRNPDVQNLLPEP